MLPRAVIATALACLVVGMASMESHSVMFPVYASTLGQAGASFAPKGSYKPPQRWLVSKKSASKAKYEVVDDPGQDCDGLVWPAVGAVLVLPALWLVTWTYRLIKSVQFDKKRQETSQYESKNEAVSDPGTPGLMDCGLGALGRSVTPLNGLRSRSGHYLKYLEASKLF